MIIVQVYVIPMSSGHTLHDYSASLRDSDGYSLQDHCARKRHCSSMTHIHNISLCIIHIDFLFFPSLSTFFFLSKTTMFSSCSKIFYFVIATASVYFQWQQYKQMWPASNNPTANPSYWSRHSSLNKNGREKKYCYTAIFQTTCTFPNHLLQQQVPWI